MKLGEIVKSGRLGELVEASAALRNWRPQSYYDEAGQATWARDGGGVLLTQAIHVIDLLLSGLRGNPGRRCVPAFAPPLFTEWKLKIWSQPSFVRKRCDRDRECDNGGISRLSRAN